MAQRDVKQAQIFLNTQGFPCGSRPVRPLTRNSFLLRRKKPNRHSRSSKLLTTLLPPSASLALRCVRPSTQSVLPKIRQFRYTAPHACVLCPR
jgi:hypothetical protein